MWIDRMYNDIVTLYRLDISQDESGNEVATLIDPQELFCKAKSIGMKEFYAAATTDMMPELTVVLADEYTIRKLRNMEVYSMTLVERM